MADLSFLPVELPHGEPDTLRRTSQQLRSVAYELHATAYRGASLVHGRWVGDAADAAATHAVRVTTRVRDEADRCKDAADALGRYAVQLEDALQLADEARRLLDMAELTQRAANAAQPREALERSMVWANTSAVDRFADPQAHLLARRAVAAAISADAAATDAARRLVSVLSDLAGFAVKRHEFSPRALVDLAGFVPVIGDGVDLLNGAAYLLQGDLANAAMSVGAAAPGPPGWAAGGGRLAKFVRHNADEIVTSARDDALALAEFSHVLIHREAFVTKARLSADQTHRPLAMSAALLRGTYNHAAPMFCLRSGYSRARGKHLAIRLRLFVDRPTTVRIDGSHDGEPAVIYMDTEGMKQMVVTQPDGTLIRAGALKDSAAWRVWTLHRA